MNLNNVHFNARVQASSLNAALVESLMQFQLLCQWTRSLSATVHMKVTKQPFPMVLFVVLYNEVVMI